MSPEAWDYISSLRDSQLLCSLRSDEGSSCTIQVALDNEKCLKKKEGPMSEGLESCFEGGGRHNVPRKSEGQRTQKGGGNRLSSEPWEGHVLLAPKTLTVDSYSVLFCCRRTFSRLLHRQFMAQTCGTGLLGCENF